MTISKRIVSGAVILFALMLVLVLMQNNQLKNQITQLTFENERLLDQFSQIHTLNSEIAQLEDENFILTSVLTEEKEVADSYRALVGDYVQKDLVAQAKEIEVQTPLDFETSYIVAKQADTFGLNVSLILSVMELESNFQQFEVGTSEDRGYMQIIPSTEEWLANTYGVQYGLEYDPERIFDADYNIGLASIYLSLLQKSYGDDYNRILSEYNRGPYNLMEYYKENNTYETTYSRVVLSKEHKYLALNE